MVQDTHPGACIVLFLQFLLHLVLVLHAVKRKQSPLFDWLNFQLDGFRPIYLNCSFDELNPSLRDFRTFADNVQKIARTCSAVQNDQKVIFLSLLHLCLFQEVDRFLLLVFRVEYEFLLDDIHQTEVGDEHVQRLEFNVAVIK